MEYVIGIDGGGTGSVLKLFSSEGKEIVTRYGGPTNITVQSGDEVEEVLRDLIIGAIDDGELQIKNCRALCIGTAGANRKNSRNKLNDIIRGIGIEGNIIVSNDTDIALVAGAGRQEGIIIISGTGSIGYGRTAGGETHRVGGWGHILGDEGGGYYIASKALNVALRSYDGRAEETLLLPLLLKETGSRDIDGLIEYTYSDMTSKGRIARLSKIVDYAFKEGDEAAKDILDDSAYELFLLADTILNKLHFIGPVTLVAHGSVLLKNDYIFNSFSGLIEENHDRIEIIRLNRDAAYGAVEMALSSLG